MRLLRHALRDRPLFRGPAIRLRMLLQPPRSTGGVLFLMYHRLPARHGPAFARQLRWLRDAGELVGVGDALASLSAPAGSGLRICLTVDDGWQDAVPALLAAAVPAALFVPSDWVGQAGRVSWDELRLLTAAGMTVGSHSASHARLARLGPAAAWDEMQRSRDAFTRELGQACHHFAAPFGQPGEDFLLARDPALARAARYRSFFTTVARRAAAGPDPFVLPRVRMEPHWGQNEIAYALWR